MRRFATCWTILLLAVGVLVAVPAGGPPAAAQLATPTVSIAPAGGEESLGTKPGKIKFAVTLSEPSASTLTVTWTVDAPGSAAGEASPDDFKKLSGTLKFKPANRTGLTPTTKYVTVKGQPDALAEGAETFTVTLSNPSTGLTLGEATATGTIFDVTRQPEISARDGFIFEGDGGTKNTLKIALTLGAPLATLSTVDVAVTGGTAEPGTDYKTIKPKTIKFKPGQTQKTVSVHAFPDGLVESDESVLLALSNPTGGATIATPAVTANILDDDTAPPPPEGFIVDTATDGSDINPGDGICDNGTGSCTLRAAVDEFNAATTADTRLVTLAADPVLSIPGADEDNNATGDIDVLVAGVEIDGQGHTINGASLDRVLHGHGADLEITDAMVTGGRVNFTSSAGGGVYVPNGALTLTGATLVDNHAINSACVGCGEGGGAFALSIQVIDSEIADNSADQGGGLRSLTSAVIERSLVRDNYALFGGGVVIDPGPTFSGDPEPSFISDSTFSGNTASWGTAVGVLGFITNTTKIDSLVVNTTFVANDSSTFSFVVPVIGCQVPIPFDCIGNPPRANLVLSRSIVLQDSTDPVCDAPPIVLQPNDVYVGTARDGGSNLATSDGGCTVGDSADPMLGPLADNGGPTPTHLPLAGSPAIDGGGACTGVDQRGITRPQGPGCDIGAVEVQL